MPGFPKKIHKKYRQYLKTWHFIQKCPNVVESQNHITLDEKTILGQMGSVDSVSYLASRKRYKINENWMSQLTLNGRFPASIVFSMEISLNKKFVLPDREFILESWTLPKPRISRKWLEIEECFKLFVSA